MFRDFSQLHRKFSEMKVYVCNCCKKIA